MEVLANDILALDWTAYIKQKKKEGRDIKNFTCSRQWERDFLTSRIKEFRPDLLDSEIQKAISLTCVSCSNPIERAAFVELVMKRLNKK